MTTRVQLEQALVAQQRLRGTLPDDVLDATVFALQKQLAEMVDTEPEHQRKQVTILFADLVGFTALAERLDPEDVREIQDAYFAAVGPAITAYGGSVEKYIGDAVLAVFGTPQTHEDDPERAVRAALAMQQAMTGLNEQMPAVSLVLRIGIHTGLVISAVDASGDFVVTGDAVNLASRLETTAKPGTVLISGDTLKFVAHVFETEALTPILVKGKSEPVRTFRIVASKTSALKPRGISGLDSPLVGRNAELVALQKTLGQLQLGKGGIVTLVGEAGIGKSRLVAEIRQDDRSEELQWVTGWCPTYGGSTAYLFWLELLRDFLGVTVEDTHDMTREVLDDQVHHLCAERYDLVYPYLSWLMSLSPTPEDEGIVQEMAAESLKERILLALKILFESAALRRPLVVVCEDLNWCDVTSLELLERMFVLSERVPLLFVCTFRPDRKHRTWEISETIRRLYSNRHTDLHLFSLSTDESGALVDNLLRSDDDHIADEATQESISSQKVKQRILKRAEGNPFFIEEVIRTLMVSGTIKRDEATGHFWATQEVAEYTIPDNLHGVLMARIDRLPQDARRTMQLAAVVGHTTPHRLLAFIINDKDLCDQHIRILQQEQILREQEGTTDVEYSFLHHLIQEAAYDSLLKKERRTSHGMIAHALEELYPERIEEQAGLLAQHWRRAGQAEKALDYLLIASDRAYRLGASWEAIEFYQAALQSATGNSPEEEAKVSHAHERLGDVYLVNLSHHSEALEHYQFFQSLAKSDEELVRAVRKLASVHLMLGDLQEAQKQYEIALDLLSSSSATFEVSRVHYGLTYLFALENRMEEAEHHAGASLEASLEVSDSRGIADAYRALSGIHKQRGDLEAACGFDEKSLEIYRQIGDMARTAQAINNVSDSYRLLGRINQARAILNEGLELTRRLSDTRDEATLLCTLAEVYLDQGRWQEAIVQLETAVSLNEESGATARKIDLLWTLASACRSAGQLEDAWDHLNNAEMLSRDTQLPSAMPQILLEKAYLYAMQSEFERSETCIKSALEMTEENQSSAFQGFVHRCYGYLHTCLKNWVRAVEHLEQSLEHFELTHLQVEVAETHYLLGRAYVRLEKNGDIKRATEHFRIAQSFFQMIDAHVRLAQVQMQIKVIDRFSSKSTIFPGREK